VNAHPVTVGLWQASLDLDPSRLAEFEATLDATELARANAFRGERLRARYVADHGWRRRLLAEVLGCTTAEVVYEVDRHGKPRVAGSATQFSASSSDDRALYAVSEDTPVGVDLERLRDDVDLEAMAKRFFSVTERAAWAATEPAQRTAAGFACWTRKEAWAKGEGSGLVFPLTTREVWAGDGRPVHCSPFVVFTVELGEGFAAAVAVSAVAVEDVDLRRQPRVMN
jgi:4'-phosphopantetheinyl transferase